MIDLFTLLLVHGLIFVALFRLMTDDSVDVDPALEAAGKPGDPDDAANEETAS